MIEQNKKRLAVDFAGLVLVTELWYFFMQESVVLRPYSSLAWIVFAAVGVLRIISIPDSGKVQIGVYGLLIALVGIYMLLNCVITTSRADALDLFMRYVLYYSSGCSLFCRGKSDKFILWTFMFAILFTLTVYLEYFLPTVYFNIIDPLLPRVAAERRARMREVDGAVLGLANQTSVTAFLLNIGVGAAIAFFIGYPRYRGTVRGYLLLIFFLVALLLTNRRGGTLIAIALVALFLMRYHRTRRSAIILASLVGLFLLLFGIEYIPGLSGMLEKINAQEGDVLHGRLGIWIEILTHGDIGFFLGNGLSSLSYNIVRLFGQTSAHSSYVQLIYELGIMGMIIFILPILYTTVKSYKVYKWLIKKDENSSQLTEVVFCLYYQAMILVMSVVESTLTNPVAIFYLAAIQFRIIQIEKNLRNDKAALC